MAVRWSAPAGGDAQDRDDLAGSGRVVRLHLVRGRAAPAVAATGQETGVDLGLESFATLADGTKIHNPRRYRQAERRLKTAQRRVSRRKKGSNRRKKAVRLLAKAHQHVKRQRQDFPHKTALRPGAPYDTIYHEDLQVANMLKNHHLAKSIRDAGWVGS